MHPSASGSRIRCLVSDVTKDAVRTDRDCPFYAGINNKNAAMLIDILVTFAHGQPELGYVQGMSDLLAPLLLVVRVRCAWPGVFVLAGRFSCSSVACSLLAADNRARDHCRRTRQRRITCSVP